MLSELIQHLVDNKQTSIADLAGVACVTEQTVRNWKNEKGNPTEIAIRLWITSHSSQAVRAAVLREITNNQASLAQPISDSEPDLDFNQDGKVDLGDAMAATMKYEKAAHDTLSLVFTAYERDPNSTTTEDFETLICLNEAAVAHMKAIDKIFSQEVARRRKAKAPRIAV